MSVAPSLLDRVRELLRAGAEAFADGAEGAHLRTATERLDQPLRLAIAGRVKAGKSTLLNALVGQELAPTDAGECTRIVTWYLDGPTYRVTLVPIEGSPRQATFTKEEGPIAVDLGGLSHEAVERLEVEWPSPNLRALTLVDTPGIASATATGERARTWLVPEDGEDEEPAPVDALLYLMRHVHGTDVRFLEAFHDREAGYPSPVNALGVLSRADEIGAARLDAMTSAGRIAARYREDPRIRRLCQTVVPLAGLLAQAGTALTEAHFRTLAAVAAMPREAADALLLSADRFGSMEVEGAPPPVDRARLQRLLGLFGVRVSVALIRQHAAPDGPTLAAELVRRSGLAELRQVIAERFEARRDVLRARSGLLAVEGALGRAGGEPRELATEAERGRAGAHEFAEMRLLSLLRAGAAGLQGPDAEEAERVVAGGTVQARLGLDEGADRSEVLAALGDAVTRWRERAESPLSGRARAGAAEVVVRSLEGMAATVTAAG